MSYSAENSRKSFVLARNVVHKQNVGLRGSLKAFFTRRPLASKIFRPNSFINDYISMLRSRRCRKFDENAEKFDE